jgi:hypothetical protein
MAKPKPKAIKMKVTTRALVQRINRKLANENQKLCATRGERSRAEFGDYYIVNLHSGNVTSWRINPDEMARQLGVLRPYEEAIDQ